MNDATSPQSTPPAASPVMGWRRLAYRPRQRIMQAVMLFAALCGLGLTAYTLTLGNSVSTALIVTALPVAVAIIPLVILWGLPFDKYIDAGKLPAGVPAIVGQHPGRVTAAAPGEQVSA